MRGYRIRKMTPVQWVIFVVVVLFMAGMLYFNYQTQLRIEHPFLFPEKVILY